MFSPKTKQKRETHEVMDALINWVVGILSSYTYVSHHPIGHSLHTNEVHSKSVFLSPVCL